MDTRALRISRQSVRSALLCGGVLLWAASCSQPGQTPALVVNANLAPEPAHVGRETVTITVRDAAAQPVRGAQVTVEANMAHPGMAPVFGEAREITPGRYAADLNLGMSGSWVVLLHLRLASGEKVERQVAVSVKAE